MSHDTSMALPVSGHDSSRPSRVCQIGPDKVATIDFRALQTPWRGLSTELTGIFDPSVRVYGLQDPSIGLTVQIKPVGVDVGFESCVVRDRVVHPPLRDTKEPSMGSMPIEPEAFAEQVAKLIERMQPGFKIDRVNAQELLVNGRRLDLENLFRMVAHEPDRGTDIVEHFLDQLFAGESMEVADESFDQVKARIMPRIQPVSIFEHLSEELVAHVPFVNNTVIVFVLDMPHMTVSITTEQVVRWGITIDELEDIARENLDLYAPELEMQVIESAEGGRAVIVAEQDGYDAARLLMSDLHAKLAHQLGADFYVATPARDMFIALSCEPVDFVDRLRKRVAEDFSRLPYPITQDLFLVTQDGVAGTTWMNKAA